MAKNLQINKNLYIFAKRNMSNLINLKLWKLMI